VKKQLINLFDFYIKSSIHVAFAVCSLALLSIEHTSEPRSISLLIFIFCSALFAYNFIKFFPIYLERKTVYFSDPIFWLSVGCFLFSFYFFIGLTIRSQLIVILGGALVLFYSIPFGKDKVNLRNTKGWKIYLVVLSWVLLTVGLPFSVAPVFDFKLFFQLLLIQSIYIFVAIIPFDIRDIAIDDTSLFTLPQRLGTKRVKILGNLILVIDLIFVIFSFGVCIPLTWSCTLCFLLLAYFLQRSSPERSKYFTSFWVESIPIFWLMCFYLIA